jgi:hypothetical protein
LKNLPGPFISTKTLKFYGTWAIIGAGIMGLVFMTLLSLEWRPVYQFHRWYREHPAPEETYTARVLRNPAGEDWIRLFVHENGTVRFADRYEHAPEDVKVIYRDYSYRIVFPDGEEMDIYGAGADVRQVRFLSGLEVDIIGKRVWYEVEGMRIKEEFWPKRLRISDPGG